MRYRQFILFLFFTLPVITGFSQYHNLSGKVVDSREIKSLSGAIITLNYHNKQQLSDTNGNFLFDSLPAGEYQLKVFYAGFPVKELTVAIDHNIHNNIVVEMNPPCKYDASRKNKTCPVCKKRNKVIPVIYGLPVGTMDTARYYYAGCEMTYCDPSWYCKRDKHLF
jgi:hypothetical protein